MRRVHDITKIMKNIFRNIVIPLFHKNALMAAILPNIRVDVAHGIAPASYTMFMSTDFEQIKQSLLLNEDDDEEEDVNIPHRNVESGA